MRAVLDVNVLVSALLSSTGAPGRLIARWLDGAFELVVSAALLAELERTLAYPKLRTYISPDDASAFTDLLQRTASIFPDPELTPRVAGDAGDDYLVAVANASASILVSGDHHLLELAPGLPIRSPAAFFGLLKD